MKFAYLIEPPFNYIDQSAGVTGCDVELARYIFKELGIENFDPIQTEFGELLPGLNNHRWQMTTGLFATEERKQFAIFSRPIWALSDGLLVKAGNPHNLIGYRSVANNSDLQLAVIRDQYQHRSAVEFGVKPEQIIIYETYLEAACAVKDGTVDAYASVSKAHSGFLAQNPEWDVVEVMVPFNEKALAYGCFAFHSDNTELRDDVNEILNGYLGTAAHRKMVGAFGVSDGEIDLLMHS